MIVKKGKMKITKEYFNCCFSHFPQKVITENRIFRVGK